MFQGRFSSPLNGSGLVQPLKTVGANDYSPATRANDYSPLQKIRDESVNAACFVDSKDLRGESVVSCKL